MSAGGQAREDWLWGKGDVSSQGARKWDEISSHRTSENLELNHAASARWCHCEDVSTVSPVLGMWTYQPQMTQSLSWLATADLEQVEA